jgi:NAD(P)-dependent dehydrogenase (short-subunit alcohol dehydrogenase family)
MFPAQPRCVVTGGGSGLGRAVCLELARRNSARILVADVNADGAAETVALVQEAGGEAHGVYCDVAQPAQVESLAAEAERLWGGTDILVNNAGVAAGGNIGEITLEDWQWIMGINLWGVIHGCHAFVPRMKTQGQGWIINVASCAGIACLPEMASYNVTKAGVIALSETLAPELAADKISVTVLCPTFFKTNLLDTFRSPNERQLNLAQAFFDRSSVTAEDVARAALDGAEKGHLYVIPQKDGKMVWRVKRLFPNYYLKQVTKQYTVGVFQKIAAKVGKRKAEPAG